MTQPTIDTTQTLLVGFTSGLPRQTTSLKQVSAQAEQKAHAKPGTVRSSMFYWKWEEVSTTTLSKGKNKGQTKVSSLAKDGLEPLKTFVGAYKAAIQHFARFPFATGAWILPAALAEQCIKLREEYEDRKPEVIEEWICKEYPKLAGSAPQRMGEFYSGADFPSKQECMEAFVADCTIIPLASADQWQRIALLAPDLAAAQELKTNEAYQKGMNDGHIKLWSEVMEPIQHAVTTLSKDGSKVYETLLGNILKIVDLVPGYNAIFKDSHLGNLAAQAKEAFGKYTTEDLRKSDDAKKAVLNSAKSLISSFGQYQRKFA